MSWVAQHSFPYNSVCWYISILSFSCSYYRIWFTSTIQKIIDGVSGRIFVLWFSALLLGAALWYIFTISPGWGIYELDICLISFLSFMVHSCQGIYLSGSGSHFRPSDSVHWIYLVHSSQATNNYVRWCWVALSPPFFSFFFDLVHCLFNAILL